MRLWPLSHCTRGLTSRSGMSGSSAKLYYMISLSARGTCCFDELFRVDRWSIKLCRYTRGVPSHLECTLNYARARLRASKQISSATLATIEWVPSQRTEIVHVECMTGRTPALVPGSLVTSSKLVSCVAPPIPCLSE